MFLSRWFDLNSRSDPPGNDLYFNPVSAGKPDVRFRPWCGVGQIEKIAKWSGEAGMGLSRHGLRSPSYRDDIAHSPPRGAIPRNG